MCVFNNLDHTKVATLRKKSYTITKQREKNSSKSYNKYITTVAVKKVSSIDINPIILSFTLLNPSIELWSNS